MKSNCPLPPIPLALKLPSFAPLQLIDVPVNTALKIAASLIVIVLLSVHPKLLSVTITEYVAADKLEAVAFVVPLLQLYE